MSIQVALTHRTRYSYDRLVALAPQIVRLRPAPHCRTPILSYSLRVAPKQHFLNWQQDPQSNYLARFVFPEKTREFTIEVDLVADMAIINPFDFFLEQSAQKAPFVYEAALAHDLKPYLEKEKVGPLLQKLLDSVDRTPRATIDFLTDLNRNLQQRIGYVIRLEPGIQTCEQTLALAKGSCRDSAWLLVQILRHLGFAARFASGYLIQLVADEKSLDGPSGTDKDFTDLHAWTEVYLPGAGWIGLDPTSGLLAGEGHIPLACTPDASSAAPISGALDECEVTFHHEMKVARLNEQPRSTKPYSANQWSEIEALGHAVDRELVAGDVRLTMGGEPTFVSIDDMDGAEWNTAAQGPDKRRIAAGLIDRLMRRFAPGGLLHFGQGKWYPGESLPRWALTGFWRRDGDAIWANTDYLAREDKDYGHGPEDAEKFITALARRLKVPEGTVHAAFEDPWHYIRKERLLPVNVDPLDNKLEDEEERARLADIFDRGLDIPRGFVLQLQRRHEASGPVWQSSAWPTRRERLFLVPGDSAIGYRLPLQSLPWVDPADYPYVYEQDPFDTRSPLAPRKLDAADAPQRHIKGAATENTKSGSQSAMGSLRSGSVTRGESATWVVRTALAIEPRHGRLYCFMPPAEVLEDYLELIEAIEETAVETGLPIIIEGYPPPKDPRLGSLAVTPDPGVIEVNVHPAASWRELLSITQGAYSEARLSRLCTEKFMVDGRHVGTGGGNHVVMGGASPEESPFLRRPDLLKSVLGFWHNHPSLSFLFSGLFIGPTSQHPRIDEARDDAVAELETAFAQVKPGMKLAPWVTDRIFRNILVDMSGNTHRTEFCIDKMYDPAGPSGRRGLVEFRAFEMPPHARMSLAQMLLMRAAVAAFWERPYERRLIHWGTRLHDRFLLPQPCLEDFRDALEELGGYGFTLDPAWFTPHAEFRFPKIGDITVRDMGVELRHALEPWHVLGEESTQEGMVRYVDSSAERVQLRVSNWVEERYTLACNGVGVPLARTDRVGEYVAGVRFKAWAPPHGLHPTVKAQAPLVIDVFDT